MVDILFAIFSVYLKNIPQTSVIFVSLIRKPLLKSVLVTLKSKDHVNSGHQCFTRFKSVRQLGFMFGTADLLNFVNELGLGILILL